MRGLQQFLRSELLELKNEDHKRICHVNTSLFYVLFHSSTLLLHIVLCLCLFLLFFSMYTVILCLSLAMHSRNLVGYYCFQNIIAVLDSPSRPSLLCVREVSAISLHYNYSLIYLFLRFINLLKFI